MSTTAATTAAASDDAATPTPELIEDVRKLPHQQRRWLRDMLSMEPDEPEGTPDDIRLAQRAEVQRRLDAIDRGEMRLYTIDETFAYLDSLIAGGRGE